MEWNEAVREVTNEINKYKYVIKNKYNGKLICNADESTKVFKNHVEASNFIIINRLSSDYEVCSI